MPKIVLSALVGVLVVAGLLAGADWFAAVVIALAAATLVDLGGLLAASGSRPVLLAAALPGIGLPIAVALNPEAGWERLPAFVAAGFMLAVALVLLFGRRRDVGAGLGATAFVSLLVGIGAASLVLLFALPDGFRWILGAGVLVVAADVGAALPGPLARARAQRDDDFGPRPLPAGVLVVVPIAVVAVTALVTALVLNPPLAPTTVAVLALVGLVATFAGGQVHRGLARDAGVAVIDDRLRLGGGLVFSVVDAALLAAPAAYVLARSAAL